MPPPLSSVPIGIPVYSDPAYPIKASIELFFDLNCPFSRKMYSTLSTSVFPLYEKRNVQFVIHHVIQPWHPAGYYLHEAALAIYSLSPNTYWFFLSKILEVAGDYSDENTWSKSRSQILEDLATLAEPLGIKKADLLSKLSINGGGNTGNEMTQQIKFVTKFHRMRGVHVTPTVYANGLEAVEVSSGWNVDQWREFLDKLLAA